jgi:multicomponent Na+:H+ antiporter subunit D
VSSSHALLASLPIGVPMTTSVLCLLTRNRPRASRAIAGAGFVALLLVGLASVVLTHRDEVIRTVFGGWPAPFGIEVAIDRLGAVLIAVTGLMATATWLHLGSSADEAPDRPELYPLLAGLVTGVGGAFATADLFNLYVWFEVMLVASVGLLSLGGSPRSLDATLKYFVLNLLGTLLLLASIALLYGATGQLGFAAIRGAWPGVPPSLQLPLATSLLVAFLVKAGAFPMFAWLPASYPSLPAPILALFAGLLTKVGCYAVLRTVGAVLVPLPPLVLEALGWIATATMLVGVIGAAYHWDLRRILAFHIISQIGYILLGIALGTREGFAATIFYTVHHIVVKANLFLVAGIVAATTGSYDLRRVGGLYASRLRLAFVFAVPALSLVGIPPMSGFWSKLLVLRETIAQGRVAWTAAALGVSVLTLYSMTKIWTEAFWKPAPAGVDPDALSPSKSRLGPAYVASALLGAVTLAISLHPEPLLAFSERAASALEGRPE